MSGPDNKVGTGLGCAGQIPDKAQTGLPPPGFKPRVEPLSIFIFTSDEMVRVIHNFIATVDGDVLKPATVYFGGKPVHLTRTSLMLYNATGPQQAIDLFNQTAAWFGVKWRDMARTAIAITFRTTPQPHRYNQDLSSYRPHGESAVRVHTCTLSVRKDGRASISVDVDHGPVFKRAMHVATQLAIPAR